MPARAAALAAPPQILGAYEPGFGGRLMRKSAPSGFPNLTILGVGTRLDRIDFDAMNHQAKFSVVAGAWPYFARTMSGGLHAETSV